MNDVREPTSTGYEAIKEKFEALKMEEEEQATRLFLRRQKMSGLQEHIDINRLMSQYNATSSFLGVVINWYGRRALWMKVAMGLAFVSIASIFHISMILSAVCYFCVGYLLDNHYKASQKKDKLIFDDLKDVNASVEASVGFMDKCREGLERTTRVLNELGSQVSNEVAGLSMQCSTLDTKNKELDFVVDTLSKASKRQIDAIEDLEKNLATAETLLTEREHALVGQSGRIDELTQLLDETTQSLGHRADDLTEVIEGYKTKTKELVAIIDAQNEGFEQWALDSLADEDNAADRDCESTDILKMQREAEEICRLADESISESDRLIAYMATALPDGHQKAGCHQELSRHQVASCVY